MVSACSLSSQSTFLSPSQIPPLEGAKLTLDFNSPRIYFEDGEPDDLAALMIALGSGIRRAVVVAEPHGKREEVLERTQKLVSNLNLKVEDIKPGNADPETLRSLISYLNSLEDHSLCINVIAPSPTLAALIQHEPLLLAKKAKRIVSLGGFAHRECEYGTHQGKKVYYTTHNYSANLPAAQALLSFAEKYKVPSYVIATDNLRLPRSINYEVVNKIKEMGTPAATYLLEEVSAWNALYAKQSSGKLEKIAKEAGHQITDDPALQSSMTPADLIAAVFDLAFEELDIESTGMESVELSEIPRYEKDKYGRFQETKHRAVHFEKKEPSPLRYVDGFKLKGLPLTTDYTFKTLFKFFTNLSWKNQSGGTMATPISLRTASTAAPMLTDELKQEESKQAQTRPATQTDPTLAAAVQSAPAFALPKDLSLEELASLTEMMHGRLPAPTLEEVYQLTQKESFEPGDFHLLTEYLNRVIAQEYKSTSDEKYNLKRRHALMMGFQAMQAYFNKKLASPEVQNDKALLFFASEGRGAESVRVFAKVILPFDWRDPKYGSKIMECAKNKWDIRPDDIVPGTGRLLKQIAPNQEKAILTLRENLQIEIQSEKENSAYDQCKKKLEETSNALAALYKDKYAAVEGYVRGPIGAGKSTFLKRLRVDEEQTFSADVMKTLLGGNLYHHRSSQLNDKLRSEVQVPYKFSVKTNTKARDNEEILKAPKPGVTRIVYDLAVPCEALKARIAKRAEQGIRMANDQELLDGYKESVQNRPALIKGAKENGWLEWHLYDNSGNDFAEVASIVNKALIVKNVEFFEKMRKEDKLFNDAIKEHFESDLIKASA